MPILQTRIFVESTRTGSWAETLIGKVIKPLATEFHDQLEWFWFSRYVCGIGLQGEDKGDCDFDAIPTRFKGHLPGTSTAGHRSMRFRFEIRAERQSAFENCLRELVRAGGYAISDIRPYDETSDTGGQRFLAAESTSASQPQIRARLVTLVYYATSQLVIDMLIGPDPNDGQYRIEQNSYFEQNPNGSSFESVHHVFCNITNVPTSILFAAQGGRNQLRGTYWGPPRGSRQLQDSAGQQMTEIFVQY